MSRLKGLRCIAQGVIVTALLAATPVNADVAEGIAMINAGKADQAHAHFEALAGEGDAEAMYHLGAIHHGGLVGTEDLDRALYWYAKAAEAGVPEAQFALGSLYYKGRGVTQDMAKALDYLAKAAEAGVLAAQYNLGMMHASGLAHSKEYGADKDKPHAYKWFKIVLAQLGEDDDREPVEQGLAFIRKEMNRAEIAMGEKLAAEWLAKNPEGVKTP